MNNHPIPKILILGSLLGFSQVALADWSTDCQQLTAPNLSNPCAPIQNEVTTLNAYMTPAPFLASTIGNFSNVDAGTPPFPNGSLFGTAASGGGSSGGSSDVLPAAGSTSSGGSSGSSSAPASSGGTFQ